MCGGNNGVLLGALAGIALAPLTAGASLGLTAGTTAALSGAAGALAGDTLIDKPAELAKKGLEQQDAANKASIDLATKQADQAQAASAKAASDADQAYNKANPKSAGGMGLLSANELQAKGGQSGTMLTGATGVDPASLLLGKKTLLGA